METQYSFSLPFLETERLVLNKVTESHCTTQYLSWLHDPEVNIYLETGRYPQTIDDLISFVKNTQTKPGLFLAIQIKSEKIPIHIGNIKIDSINWLHRTAEYGILMGEKKEWKKGYAKEASISVIDHCFDKLNLRKITLGVIADNVGAAKLYEKLGFVTEGVLRKHVFCDGSYRDILRMGVFKEEWKTRKK